MLENRKGGDRNQTSEGANCLHLTENVRFKDIKYVRYKIQNCYQFAASKESVFNNRRMAKSYRLDLKLIFPSDLLLNLSITY